MPIYHNQLNTLPTATERVFRTIFTAASGDVNCSLHENVLTPYAVIPLHRHSVAEVLICISGAAECSIGDAPAETYGAGSVVVIPPNTQHTIRNTRDTHLRQLSFFAIDPPNTQWLEAPGSVDHVAT